MKKSLIKILCICLATVINICLVFACCHTSCSNGEIILGEDTLNRVVEVSSASDLTSFANETSLETSKNKISKIKETSKPKKEKTQENLIKTVADIEESTEEEQIISVVEINQTYEAAPVINEFSEEEYYFDVEEFSIIEEPSYENFSTYYTSAYSPYDFPTMGVINWGGWTWTYYSEIDMPGEDLPIPGRHLDEYGFVCDENDYICVASSALSKGTIIDTPFGKCGKVYDCGCLSYVIDCYVHW